MNNRVQPCKCGHPSHKFTEDERDPESNVTCCGRPRHASCVPARARKFAGLLFRGSTYAWFPAHVASCLEALILPR
jgi:hypothetical protein